MIIYRKKFIFIDYEKTLREKGIFEIMKKEEDLLKDFEQLNISLFSFQELKEDICCYQIPSNRLDYLFESFKANENSFLYSLIHNKKEINFTTLCKQDCWEYSPLLKKNLIVLTLKLDDYSLFLLKQLVFKLNYRERKVTFEKKTESDYELTFFEDSSELILLISVLNCKKITLGNNYWTKEKVLKRITRKIKNVRRNIQLEEELLSFGNLKNWFLKPQKISFLRLLELLKSFDSSELPHIEDIYLNKDPLRPLEKIFIEQKGFFHTKIINKEQEKDYLGFTITKNNYHHYYRLREILSYIVSEIDCNEIFRRISIVEKRDFLVLVNTVEVVII